MKKLPFQILLSMALGGELRYSKGLTSDAYHPFDVKNGVRPMFKQNKRAEAKRLRSK